MAALRRHRIVQTAERLRAGPVWQDLDPVFATEIGTPIDAGNFLTRTHYPLLDRADCRGSDSMTFGTPRRLFSSRPALIRASSPRDSDTPPRP